MRKFLPARLSPALVIAVIALVATLGGTSYAALSVVPNNSVGTKQLKNGAVTTAKLKQHAVTASKINPSGLTVPDATHANTADTATTATTADHLATLPSGSTESGSFAVSGPSDASSDYLGVGISFPQPLAAPLASSSNVVATLSTTSNCPGVGQAAAGYLCLYLNEEYGPASASPNYIYTNSPTGAGKYGVILYWDSSADASEYVSGSWSLTAP